MKKFAVFILALLAFYILAPKFVKRGLVHNFANVDDYKLFKSNSLNKSATPIPWTNDALYNTVQPSSELLDFFKKRKTCAFLVIKDGKVKYEKYDENYTEETISGSFSMAKTVNALLIGKLIEEGKIKSINDDVKLYVPELTQVPAGKLTIKEVLTMSANFKWSESYWNIFSLTAESYYGKDLKKLMGKLSLKEDGSRGKLWDYQSCCTQILGFIIKNTSGKSITDYANEKLWQPIGAENDALWSTDDETGTEKSFCCINATARDFAKLGYLVLNHGKVNGKQIIDSVWISQMTKPATNLKMGVNSCDWYGYQMWVVDYKGQQIPYFRGILGQFIFVLPKDNAVIVRLGKIIKKDEQDPHQQNQDIRNYIEAGLQVIK